MRSSIIKTISASLILAVVPLAMVALPACETDRAERVHMSPPTLELHPTARKVYAGEIVTITTETRNLVGREAELRWSTTGGELTTEENGRIARVRFDRPGTYVVSAQLFVNGDLAQTDSVNVEVLPLR